MTDRILDDLLKFRSDLQADLQRVNRAIAALQEDTPAAHQPIEAPTVNRRRPALYGKDRPLTIVHAAVDILREKGRPMLTTELVLALEATGLRLGGTDKTSNLATMLARFRHVIRSLGRGKGYWPANEPTPTQALDLQGDSAEPAEPVGYLHLHKAGLA